MRTRTKRKLLGRLRTAGWLALACVLVFDASGLVINRMLLDEAARVAAAHAAAELRDAGRVPTRQLPGLARLAAEESLADQPGIDLREVAVEQGTVRLVVSRHAKVVLAGRVRRLGRQVEPLVTAVVPIEPRTR